MKIKHKYKEICEIKMWIKSLLFILVTFACLLIVINLQSIAKAEEENIGNGKNDIMPELLRLGVNGKTQEDLFVFLIEEYEQGKFSHFCKSVRNGGELWKIWKEVYGTPMMQDIDLLFKYISFLEKRALNNKEVREPHRLEKVESEHFIFFYAANSRAAENIEQIKQEMESAYSGMTAKLGITKKEIKLLASFANIDREKMKIPIYLYRSLKEARKYCSGPEKVSATQIYADSPASDKFNIRIVAVYYNSFFNFVLIHELCNVFNIVWLVDMTDSNSFSDDIKALGYSAGALGESVSFWMQSLYGLPFKCGLFPPVDQMVKDLLAKGEFVPIQDILKKCDSDTGYFHKKSEVCYPELASFDRFLIEKFGMTKFKQLLQDMKKNKIDAFLNIYGQNLPILEQEWLRYYE